MGLFLLKKPPFILDVGGQYILNVP